MYKNSIHCFHSTEKLIALQKEISYAADLQQLM
jgi:hypothetical protein